MINQRRYLKQILVQNKDKATSIHTELKKKISFNKVAKSMANLTEDDIDLGWNTKSELPEEIVDSVFKLTKNQFTIPVKSSFGWHIIKLIDLEERKEITFNEVKSDFKSEILLDKGKEAVFDLQDELEDLIASGNTFDEISKILDVELIKSNKINRNGITPNTESNKGLQDERILRTIFNQKLNEEGNIINTDKDEGLAISIVTEIIEPKQLTFEDSLDQVTRELTNKLKKKQAKEKAEKIKNKIANIEDFTNIAKKYNLEIRGVKPFTRILPDDSELPIPLISKIFDSNLFEVNIQERGLNEIIIAQTVEIIDDLAKDNKEINEFSKRIKDDITVDLLAQFSEALRKKYKITINDDVIDQLN